MIDFDNTQIAFAGKSDSALRWSSRLFKLMGSPLLVSLGETLQKIAFNLRLPVKGWIKKTVFRQFCGGEFIEECAATIAELHRFGIGTILDYSVEGKETEDELDASRDEIIATIQKANRHPAIPFAVFKLTGICRAQLLEKVNGGERQLSAAEENEWTAALDRLDAICKAAHEVRVPVFIDAEESYFQDAIDDLADRMMAVYNRHAPIVYTTLQMYRHDRLAFLKECCTRARQKGYVQGIKLVRGAYMEKERNQAASQGVPSPIYPDKAATDSAYDEALTYIVQHIDHIALCAGTHNEKSTALLLRLMEQQGIEKQDKRIYFAQLLGMSDHISYNLAHHGYNVAKYVPYGPIEDVMPYLIRRARENTSVAGQSGRELKLIVREQHRRKNNVHTSG